MNEVASTLSGKISVLNLGHNWTTFQENWNYHRYFGIPRDHQTVPRGRSPDHAVLNDRPWFNIDHMVVKIMVLFKCFDSQWEYRALARFLESGFIQDKNRKNTNIMKSISDSNSQTSGPSAVSSIEPCFRQNVYLILNHVNGWFTNEKPRLAVVMLGLVSV